MTAKIILSDIYSIPDSEDCACSDSIQSVFFYNKADTYALANDIYIQKIADNFSILFNTRAQSISLLANKIVIDRCKRFEQAPQLLSNLGDYQLYEKYIVVPETQDVIIIHSPVYKLEAWIHITNVCNLDCVYCYVQKTPEQMKDGTGLEAVHKLFEVAQINQFSHIHAKYAGGEALLNFKLVNKLHSYATQLAISTNIKLSAVVLSNGLSISPHIAAWLKHENIKLMISIDGIGETHDRQRSNKHGKGSFARISQTIETLLSQDIKPDLSITVTSLNAPHIASVVEWALKRDLHFHLNFYRQPTCLQPTDALTGLSLEETTIIEGMKAAYAVIEKNLPDRPLLNSLLDKVRSTAHTHPCGVGKNYVVVTHRGEFAQCQMRMDQTLDKNIDPAALLPALATGPIQNLAVDDKSECRSCVFRYRCAGGCPLETYHATGTWNRKSPHCNIYKTLYPLVLRLEGLRLLKQYQRATPQGVLE